VHLDLVSASRSTAARILALGNASAPLALIGFVFWVHLYEFSTTLQWDTPLFFLVGKYFRQGLLPYRDLWEVKPPGVFAYLAATFSVLSEAVWSVRIADFFFHLCAALAFYRVCLLAAGWPLALAAAGLWTYFGHHERFNFGGMYTEEYVALCEILAVSAAIRYGRRGGWAVVGCGFAISAAILFKHPGAAVLLPVLILMTARPRIVGFASLMAAVVIPIAIVVLYFWLRGGLPEFLDANLWYPMVHGRLGDASLPWLQKRLADLSAYTWGVLRPHPILLAALVPGLLVSLLRPNRLRLAALGWFVADLAAIGAQGLYSLHHYIQIFPSIALLGAIGSAWLLQPRAAEPWRRSAPRLALTLAVVLLGWLAARSEIMTRHATVRRQWAVLLQGPTAWQQHPGFSGEAELARYLREGTVPQDRIQLFAWGTALSVYWIADRLPGSRYADTLYRKHADRAFEQLADLDRTRPQYIVMMDNEITPWLLKSYGLESVRWGIWARHRERPFSDGHAVDLVATPDKSGLQLSTSPSMSATLRKWPEPVRGVWMSPVVRVRPYQGKFPIDWNPRAADLASNPTNRGLARIRTSYTSPQDDARALLGTPTLLRRWTAWPRSDPQALTLSLGFRAIVDRIELAPYAAGAIGPAEADVLGRPPGAAAPRSRIDGKWRTEGDVSYFTFTPAAVEQLELVITPKPPAQSAGLRRVRVRAAGMGITVRYRSGTTPDLHGSAWQEIADSGGDPEWAPGEEYVQVQYELWSDYQGATPVLHYAQIGRERFSAEPVEETDTARFTHGGWLLAEQ
jgi:hypothetical protein